MAAIFTPEMTALAKTITLAIDIPDEYIRAYSNATWALFGPSALAFEEGVNFVLPGFVDSINDLRVRYTIPTRFTLPLMGRPIDALFAVFLYFTFLVVFYFVGRAVGKRSYRLFGLVHNSFLTLLSFYMASGLMLSAIASGFDSLWNNPMADTYTDDVGWAMVKFGWLYLVSKLPEFGDTFLMLLKHNYRQVSFLHLYHHSSIFLWTYTILCMGPGGDLYYASMVNSWVHVIMYGYYAGTLAFKDGPVRRVLDSFKFMITKVQITQFFLNLGQAVYGMFLPEETVYYPRFLCVGQAFYMVSMVILFVNFLHRNQGKPKQTKQVRGATSGKESKKEK